MAEHVKRQTTGNTGIKGLNQRKLTSENNPPAMVLEVEVSPAGSHPRTQSIKSDRFYVCLEGTVLFQVQDKPVRIQKYDAIYLKREEWYSYTNDSNAVARVLLVQIPLVDPGA